MRIATPVIAAVALAACAHATGATPLPVLRAGERDAAPAACWDEPDRLYDTELAARYDAVLLARAIVSALSRPGPYDDLLPGLAGIRQYRAEGYPVYLVTAIDADLGDLPPRLHVTADRFAPAADVHDHQRDVFVVELRLEGAVRGAGATGVRLAYSHLPAGDRRDPDRTRWRFGYIGQLCAIEGEAGDLVIYWKTLLVSSAAPQCGAVQSSAPSPCRVQTPSLARTEHHAPGL